MLDVELVTTLKRNATKIIAQVRKRKRPLLITQRGRPAAYLIDAESFDKLQERMALLQGIARGERDVQEGRVLTHAQVEKLMKKRWPK